MQHADTDIDTRSAFSHKKAAKISNTNVAGSNWPIRVWDSMFPIVLTRKFGCLVAFYPQATNYHSFFFFFWLQQRPHETPFPNPNYAEVRSDWKISFTPTKLGATN